MYTLVVREYGFVCALEAGKPALLRIPFSRIFSFSSIPGISLPVVSGKRPLSMPRRTVFRISSSSRSESFNSGLGYVSQPCLVSSRLRRSSLYLLLFSVMRQPFPEIRWSNGKYCSASKLQDLGLQGVMIEVCAFGLVAAARKAHLIFVIA